MLDARPPHPVPVPRMQASTRGHIGYSQPVACTGSRLVIAALALILAGAGLLRLSGLDREGRWGDEYQQTRSYDLPLTYPHYVVMAAKQQGQPPLDYLIGWLLTRVHRSDWMRRMPAAVFGILGVALCFALTRRMFSPPAGLVAAGLLAVAPLHTALSREVRPYTIAMAAMLLALLAMERALSQPVRRRLIVYAVVAYVFTLTRGLLPLVVLLSIGVSLTLVWVLPALSGKRPTEFRHTQGWPEGAIRRVWFTTLLVGLAAVPMVFFLVSGNPYTVLNSAGRTAGTLRGQPLFERLSVNLAAWADLPRDIFGEAYAVVLAFVFLGLLRLWREVRRARGPSPTSRLILGVMLLSGPLYLIVYSATVSFHPINTRYGMFLTPILSIIAALGFVQITQWLRQIAPERIGLRVLASTVVLSILVASPMHMTLRRMNYFSRPDWRGCAARLEPTVSPNDVIVVFQDRPLLEPQATFWGKYDWPVSMARPLAEPLWSLASSESHWQRLTKQDGQVYVVIRREVRAGPEDIYLSYGLAEAPSGATLEKFRGLDLLTLRSPADSAVGRLIQACNLLASMPKEHADSDAMVLALRSRLELLGGQFAFAVESYDRAQQLVPAGLSDWFADSMADHITALNQARKVALRRSLGSYSVNARPGAINPPHAATRDSPESQTFSITTKHRNARSGVRGASSRSHALTTGTSGIGTKRLRSKPPLSGYNRRSKRRRMITDRFLNRSRKARRSRQNSNVGTATFASHGSSAPTPASEALPSAGASSVSGRTLVSIGSSLKKRHAIQLIGET